ncbi:hypothetical protein [uncultured Nocardioides sp.]|uniref:hypothetical protein n=1 Tax=uncultured Nocardioides sp. TaxID=198441 RepID=UPI000C5769D6|nr:hypothetical protein [uncultured Nocardioides sp.]MAO79685.1 hypothetical protein [Nocardioides sp.]
MRVLLLLAALLALVGCSDDPADPVGAASTVTPAPTSATQPPRDRGPLRGDPPRLAYVDGHVLRRPDGATLALPRRWSVTSIETYAGGFLVTDDRSFEGTVGMHRLDRDGRVLGSWASTGPALVGRGGRIAWVSLVPSEGGRTGPTLLVVDAVAGGQQRHVRLDRTRVPFLTRWFRGEVVYRTWGEESSYRTDGLAAPRPVPLAAELGVPSPDGRQWAALTGEGLELRQPDGQLLGVVRERGLRRTVQPGVAWEDDDHVLATLVRGRRMCLARIDTRLSADRALSCTTSWERATSAGIAVLPAR